MHTYYDAKEMLHKELEEIVRKGELSAGSLDTIDKLLNSIKNACKIIMYDEYAEDSDYSSRDGYSYARGEQRRDARGRYSRARDGRRINRRYSRDGYSYDDGEKAEKVELLREMMNEVNSEEERRALQKIIRRIDQD